jgi:hypothetical protein
MALKFLNEGYGHGQVELNNVFFRREGAIEAQCALDPSKFAKEGEATDSIPYCQNGMILAVDKANGIVTLPSGAAEMLPLALVYSTEHMYDERKNSLGDFYLPVGTFYPRMGYLQKGEVFTTNAVAYDDTKFENLDAIKEKIEAGLVAGVASDNGRIALVTSEDGDTSNVSLILRAVKYYTMPNGAPGIKFQVIKNA